MEPIALVAVAPTVQHIAARPAEGKAQRGLSQDNTVATRLLALMSGWKESHARHPHHQAVPLISSYSEETDEPDPVLHEGQVAGLDGGDHTTTESTTTSCPPHTGAAHHTQGLPTTHRGCPPLMRVAHHTQGTHVLVH